MAAGATSREIVLIVVVLIRIEKHLNYKALRLVLALAQSLPYKQQNGDYQIKEILCPFARSRDLWRSSQSTRHFTAINRLHKSSFYLYRIDVKYRVKLNFLFDFIAN